MPVGVEAPEEDIPQGDPGAEWVMLPEAEDPVEWVIPQWAVDPVGWDTLQWVVCPQPGTGRPHPLGAGGTMEPAAAVP